MKKVTLLFSSLILLLISCNKEQEQELLQSEIKNVEWKLSLEEDALHFETQADFEAFVVASTHWKAEEMKKFLEPYVNEGFQRLSESTIKEYEIPEALWLLNENQTLRVEGKAFSFNFEQKEVNMLDLATNERKKFSFETDVFAALNGEEDLEFRNDFCPYIYDSNSVSYFGGDTMNGIVRYQNWGIYRRLYSRISKSSIDNAFSLYMYVSSGFASNTVNTITWSGMSAGGNGSNYSITLYNSTRRLIAYNLSADFMVNGNHNGRPQSFPLGISCGGTTGNGAWKISEEGQGSWEVLNNSTLGLDQLLFGDFIGDERTDILHIANATTFKVSDGGATNWIDFSTSAQGFEINTLKVGDFVGNSKKELFTNWGNGWKAYNFSDQTWHDLANSGYGVNQVAIGDFIGDSRDDVFMATGSVWRASNGGVGNWEIIHGSDYTLGSLAFGDFIGDEKTDVFLATGSDWRIAESGQENWLIVNGSDYTLPYLLFGDFVGDHKTDVLRPDGTHWKVSESAQNNWQTINTSGYTVNQLKVGDFTGSYTKDEVFTVE